jgi:predicted dehydrogenase
MIDKKDNYPYFVTGSFLQSTEPKKDIGAIFNYLHHFDILENLFGDKIRLVYSQANLISKSLLETNVTVLIEYKNNLKVNLNLGWIPTGKFRTLEFFSKKNHVKCDLMKQEIEIIQNERPTKFIKFNFDEPLNLELKEFVNCINTKKSPKANGYVGAKVIKIAETATKSFQKNKMIKIN